MRGPRIVIGLEGTRSYAIGLARALDSAGLAVVEVECPRRHHRRCGKSDPIDARLAALEVLRMDDVRKPLPRRDGEREAIRILPWRTVRLDRRADGADQQASSPTGRYLHHTPGREPTMRA
jgi:hypothetical protein